MNSDHENRRQIPKLRLELPPLCRSRSRSNDFDSTSGGGFRKRHSKSHSQDSITFRTGCNGRNGILDEQSSDSYFQRLCTLPPTEHLPMRDISLREAGRNILYAFSQVHKALRQFIRFTGNERIFAPELNKASTLITQLSAALQRFDTLALQTAPDAFHWSRLLMSIQENLSCFKSLMESLRKRLKSLTQSYENIRYSRTLLLTFHGTVADIKFAWEHLFPLLNDYTPYTGPASRARSSSRSNSINTPPYSSGSPNGSYFNGAITTPTAYPYAVNNDAPFPAPVIERLILLSENSIKAVEFVLKHLCEQIGNELSPSINEDASRPSSPIKNKMMEMKLHVKYVSEATDRLKKSLTVFKFSTAQKENSSIQFKLYKDTISFLQKTVKMSTMAKEISQEWKLDGKIMSGLGQVTKTNIKLANLLRSVEEVPSMVDDGSSPNQLSPNPMAVPKKIVKIEREEDDAVDDKEYNLENNYKLDGYNIFHENSAMENGKREGKQALLFAEPEETIITDESLS
ncbi:4412_t:CDS:2 [Acaulospora colombiana]|uniref:4412_t:CDS:1 n=1 Tax=Acaulospora colombiana TaxID=27376 RepID=A0ACA9K4R5_9GLOM|nr:4412_t:CDS:2 [Acaulospora colombiana]